MNHSEKVDFVMKYQSRLQPENEVKKILRALTKLKEVEMTVDVLQETGVGKTVNSLRKLNGVGDLAKSIVTSWKALLPNNNLISKNSSKTLDYSVAATAASNEDEYDPSQNWEMMKNHKVSKSKPNCAVDNDEYDPTQNWKMSKHGKDCSEEEVAYSRTEKLTKERLNSSSPIRNHHPVKESSSRVKKSRHNKSSDHQRPLLSPTGVSDCYDNSDEEQSYVPSVQSTTLYSGDSKSTPNNALLHVKRLRTSAVSDCEKKERISSAKVAVENSKHKKQQAIVEDFASPTAKNNSAVDNHPLEKKYKSEKRKVKRTSSSSKGAPAAKQIKHDEGSVRLNGKVKKQKKAADKSFEDFMTMDTTKVSKKKKKSAPKPATVSSSSALAAQMLAARPKVELHLPEIQTTYQPLPANPHHHQRHSSEQSASQMTDAMAAELHTKRSSKRMQIYSGQKTACLPRMLSLYEQCMSVLMNNIDKLDVIGVPYDIIKPVLERCSAEQLYRLEDLNNYLLEDTDELWQKLCSQEFRGNQPDEFESWREMYLRLHDAREEKLTRLTQTIQAKAIKAKPLEKRTKLAFVGLGEAKAPRNVLRAQIKYGTAGKKSVIKLIQQTRTKEDGEKAVAMKEQATEMRMSVPIGSITAATVDGQSSSRAAAAAAAKKQAPRVAPMMAKTLKSINKLRYRR